MFRCLEVEKPLGVVVQFGGQTAINLAKPLAQLGIPILGTTVAILIRPKIGKDLIPY